jgi:mono/diheme cytochrome c family protein
MRIHWVHIVLVVVLALVVTFIIRLHGAAGQVAPPSRAELAEQGRLLSQGWCTECHSVQPETAGTGRFAPDFTVIARRRSAHWLNVFLRTEHQIMPDFVFKTSEADAIVTYILSLKK